MEQKKAIPHISSRLRHHILEVPNEARGVSGIVTVSYTHLDVYKRQRQVGRICMDMCMVDVTDMPEVRAGDIVTVFGDEPEDVYKRQR